MQFELKDISSGVERDVNKIVEYFSREYGCVCNVSKEYPSSDIAVALELNMPPNQIIFMPITYNVQVFRIDTKSQLITVIFTPELVERT